MNLLYGRLSEVARTVGDAYHSGARFILGHGAGLFDHVTARHLDLISPGSTVVSCLRAGWCMRLRY